MAAKDHSQNSNSAPTSTLFLDQKKDTTHANKIGITGEAVQYGTRKPGYGKEEIQVLRNSANLKGEAELLLTKAEDT
ncbi:hypothetical protein P7K49_016629 [Saguinus oedipus]|uniref:Uncharacterized protein n=1 Tax=Saguinus oedipus TaxID=9490 RepID=A0ABQ9VDD9_SAGOE|nr:hypothetical protein P7K49_016629 [Saguinus oedipus]